MKINRVEFDIKYPKNPKTFGGRLRKTRMDKGLQIKDLAKIIGVSSDTVINWEIRNIVPRKKHMARLRKFISL